MRLRDRILLTGIKGDDVRDLHDELEQLDFFVLPAERRNALFGPGTRKAVMDLQREHFVFARRVKGIVDRATANMINVAAGRYVA